MAVTKYGVVLTLAVSAILAPAMVGCGGKTGIDATNGPVASSGGSLGVGGDVSLGGSVSFGGNVPVGGNVSTVVMPPRVPKVHRAEALACVGVNSPEGPNTTSGWYSELSTCARHADCTEGENGKCIPGIGMTGGTYSCTYDTCATDAECDPGQVCYCTGTTSARCLSVGNCQVDADCGGGGYSYCSPSMSWNCGGYRPVDGFHCHTAPDTCMDDTDCAATDFCNFSEYKALWECTPTNNGCIIG